MKEEDPEVRYSFECYYSECGEALECEWNIWGQDYDTYYSCTDGECEVSCSRGWGPLVDDECGYYSSSDSSSWTSDSSSDSDYSDDDYDIPMIYSFELEGPPQGTFDCERGAYLDENYYEIECSNAPIIMSGSQYTTYGGECTASYLELFGQLLDFSYSVSCARYFC